MARAGKRLKTRLTPKQKKFVEELGKGNSKVGAALVAYPDAGSYRNASVQADKVVKKLEQTFPEIMESVGLTDRTLVQTVFRNLTARKRFYSKQLGDFIEEDDGFIQLKAAELGLKLKGRLNKEQPDATFNFVITRGDVNTPIVVENKPGESVEE